MNNWLTRVVALALTTAALASCNKDEDKVTMQPSAALSLQASAPSVVLQQINDPQTAVTFQWNAAQFALSGTESTKTPAITYRLQVAKTPDGFGYTGNKTIDAGTNPTRAVTVEELNNILNAIGFAPNAPANAYVRVVAYVGADDHTFASAPVPLNVTAYPACLPPNTDTWGLVGPAGDGWPGANLPAPQPDRMMKWNCSLQAYTLRTTLTAGPFKFRQNQKWDVDLGGNGNPMQGVSLSRGGSDLNIATAGTYTVKLEVTGSGSGVTGGRVTVTP
jgi:hypothetical protein